MKAVRLIILLVLVSAALPLHAQEDACDPDDLAFLATDFLEHFSAARSESERFNLMFEYLSFVAVCHEDFACGNLNTRYAQRLAEAETLDDLLLANLDLSANLVFCYSERPDVSGGLVEVFHDLGLECAVPIADADYVYAECTGPHDLATAYSLYAATLTYLGVESVFFDVLLDDGDLVIAYTFTGDAWLVQSLSE